MKEQAMSAHAANSTSVAQLMEQLKGASWDVNAPMVLLVERGAYVVRQYEVGDEGPVPQGAEPPDAPVEELPPPPQEQPREPQEVPPGTPFSPVPEGQYRLPESEQQARADEQRRREEEVRRREGANAARDDAADDTVEDEVED
jgi:hypothetical protein